MLPTPAADAGNEERKDQKDCPGPDGSGGASSTLPHAPSTPQDTVVLRCAAPGASDMGSPAIAASGQVHRGGRFRIVRPHARGGLGEVFVAYDSELNREVALKEIQIRHALRPESRSRFLLEAEITGGLEHPGVVPVYGLGAYDDGRPYYAMRFIRGESLLQAIERFHATPVAQSGSFQSLEFRQLLRRFIDVCNAIQYAHDRGVIHRDVKPGNVMLGKYGETLVVDWGLAKALGRADACSVPEGEDLPPSLRPVSADKVADTQLGQAIGTPAYMSPEQAAGQIDQVGPATDIYSLGATLYHLLAGRPPFTRGNARPLRDAARSASCPRPSEIQRNVPRPLEAICLRAMAPLPVDRYITARSVAEELERWLADEPVAAYVEPLWDRGRRFVKRHRTLVTASVVGVLIAMVGLAALSAVIAASNRRLARANETIRGRNEQITAQNTRISAINAQLTVANGNLKLARAEADQKRTDAERSRDEAQAVSDYLVSAFRSPDPARDGRRITVAEMLASAAKRAQAEFADKPLVKARMLHALGQTYVGLGLPREALPLCAEAMELRRENLGEDAPETLVSVCNLANAQHEAGDFENALPLSEKALRLCRDQFGSENPLTVIMMSNLGSMYAARGRIDEAIAILEKARESSRRLAGDEASQTLICANNLGDAYRAAGRLEEAMPLLEETLALRRKVLGPKHADTLVTLGNLAEAYREAGLLEKAFPLAKESVQGRREKYGDDHIDTALAMNNLGFLYQETGKLELALPLLEAARRQLFDKLGPDHPKTLTSEHNLAGIYKDQGNLPKAVALLEEVLKRRRQTMGEDHRDTLSAASALGLCYSEAGQSSKAVPLLEETLRRQKAALGSEDGETLVTMNNLALALDDAGDLEKAIPLYEEVVERWRTKKGPHGTHRFLAMNNLATAYQRTAQPEKAVSLLEEALAGLRFQVGEDHPHVWMLTGNLGAALLEARRVQEAVKRLRDCYEGLRRSLGPQHTTVHTAGSKLAGAYEAAGQLEDADRTYAELIEQMQASDPANQTRLLMPLVQLAECRMRGEKFSEAEPPLRQALQIAEEQFKGQWPPHDIQSLLGAAMTGQRKFDEAEKLLLSGYEGLAAKESGIPPAQRQKRLTQALSRLVKLYEDWGKREAANTWRERLKLRPSMNPSQ
ncbi:MAG: serine/threonine protein kinase [Planctomycetia bacterium]|nr:serine/threonine protein kinase [Planctomycetia bacterium]